MFGRAAILGCTISSDGFNGGDFVSFQIRSHIDHWITIDLTVLDECWINLSLTLMLINRALP